MARETTLRTGRVRASVVFLALVCVALGAFVGARWRGPAGTAQTPADSASGTEAPMLWTCSMHPEVIQDHPGSCPICHMQLTPMRTSAHSGAVAIDPVVVQSMGVRTARVLHGTSTRRLRAYGTLEERTSDHRDITLRVSGWIESVPVNMDGLMVAKGEPLFTLASPELTVAIEELIEARKQRDSDDAGARAFGATLLASARQKLVFLGLDEATVDQLAQADAAPSSVTFTSPLDGHAINIAVYAGSTVKAGDRVVTIANNRKLWIDLHVPAKDASRVVGGSTVHAHIDGYPGESFDGVVSFVHPHVDMQARTALVRAEIDNQAMRLREGLWASAELELSADADALCVPREAVIDTGVRAIAFVALGGGRFEPREVVLGASADGGLVEILSGLLAGEEVVVSAQFLLDSESRLREAIRKFLAPDQAANVASEPRPAWADGVDALVERYLELSDALGRPQESGTPLDAAPLVAAASELARRAPADTRVAAVLGSAQPLVNAKLVAQRELFKTASEAIVDLVLHVPPSDKIGSARLYVMYCPMAPGRWLQRDASVRNPYYATTMKECGEVVRPLALAPERKP